MTPAQPPVLTMIIPVYNRREMLPRVLGCVEKALRIQPFDVIVVDNGSTDGSADEATRLLRAMPLLTTTRRMVLQETRRGASAARNCGLAATGTPYVMFFDSDDTFEPELPQLAVETALATGSDLIVWEIDTTTHSYLPPTYPCGKRGHHLFHGSLSTQRYAVRTDLLRRAGGWNEELPVWNDLECGVRILAQHPTISEVPGRRALAHVLQHAASITGSRFSDRPGQRELSLDAIEQTYNRTGATDMIPMVDARRLILAEIYAREGARDAAEALRRKVYGRPYKWRTAAALRLVATVQHILGRGGSATALALL